MRYYFDLDGDGGLTRDTDGMECGTLSDVRHKAIRLLAEIAGGTHACGDRLHLTTRVRDAKGAPVYQASLAIAGYPV
jgi:hypothetical protein